MLWIPSMSSGGRFPAGSTNRWPNTACSQATWWSAGAQSVDAPSRNDTSTVNSPAWSGSSNGSRYVRVSPGATSVSTTCSASTSPSRARVATHSYAADDVNSSRFSTSTPSREIAIRNGW